VGFIKTKLLKALAFLPDLPIGFFDGVVQLGLCEAWMVLFVNKEFVYHMWLNYGVGTNTRTKILTLWSLL